MGEDKVKPIRIDPDTRTRNRLGKLAVPCEVSGRWLQVRFEGNMKSHEMLRLSVMTGSVDDSRKLCELIIRKDDLARALEEVCQKQ